MSASKAPYSMTKFPQALAAAGLAAVLVGCGGGSSDSTTTTPGDTPKTPPTAPTPVLMPANLSKLVDKDSSSWAPQGTLTIQPGEDQTSGAVIFTCDDGGDPCSVTVAADGKSAMFTGGNVSTGLTAAAQTALDAPPPTGTVAMPARLSELVDDNSSSWAPQGTFTIQPGGEKTSGAVIFTCDAGGDPCTVEVATDGKSATFTGGNVTTYLTRAANNRVGQIDQQAKNSAATKLAEPYKKAIKKWEPSTDLKNYDLPTGTKDLTIKNDGKTTTIELMRSNNKEIDRTKVDSAPSGFTAYSFEPNDKSKGTVFTNLHNPKDKKYEWDTLFGIPARDNVTGTPTGNITDSHFSQATSSASDVISFSANLTGAGTNDLMRADFSGTSNLLPAISKTTRTVSYKTPDSVTTKYLSKSGKFLGVNGTFECNVPCDLTVTPEGVVTVTTGIMTFRPKPTGDLTVARFLLDNQSVSRTERDKDYMYFGYWYTTGGTTANPTQTIDTFARATDDYGDLTTNFNSSDKQLRGLVTYSGNAAGFYVQKDGAYDYSGEFIATAELRAQFGQLKKNDVGQARQYMIEGTISDFKAITVLHDTDLGELALPDLSAWELNLGGADLARTARDATENTLTVDSFTETDLKGFTGTTSSDGVDTTGKWKGDFYGGADTGLQGNDNGTLDKVPAGYTDVGQGPGQGLSADEAKFDDYPLAVVGEFSGHFDNGSVVGAFGAEKKED